jgi:TolA-binding protein
MIPPQIRLLRATPRLSIFIAMKRLFGALLGLSMTVGLPAASIAQTSSPDPAATAERDYAEERYRRLNALMEQLVSAQASLQSRLSSLTEESQRLRADLNRTPRHVVTHEELRLLERKLQEINEKREADKRLILEQLDKLLKKATAPAPAAKIPAKTTPTKKPKPAKKPSSKPSPAAAN